MPKCTCSRSKRVEWSMVSKAADRSNSRASLAREANPGPVSVRMIAGEPSSGRNAYVDQRVTHCVATFISNKTTCSV